MSSLHLHSFGAGHKQVKTIWVPRVNVYVNTLFQKIIADPNLNLSRTFPLDTDCNTQTKKILLENQRAAPVHRLPQDQPHSPYSWNPHLITILTAYADVTVLLILSLPFFLSLALLSLTLSPFPPPLLSLLPEPHLFWMTLSLAKSHWHPR